MVRYRPETGLAQRLGRSLLAGVQLCQRAFDFGIAFVEMDLVEVVEGQRLG